MQTRLLLDEQSVAAHEGVRFRLNPAQKHTENPVLLPGEPHEWDSLQVSWPATVLYDAVEEKFRCWYSGLDIIQTPDRFWRAGYAESEDGVHWHKPTLGQVTFLERPTNQIQPTWDATNLSFVFENPLPDAPATQRFGSYWSEIGRNAAGQFDLSYMRKALAYSPDGVRWTRVGTAYEATPFERASFQDIAQLLFEPEEPDPTWRVKGYGQIMRPRRWDGRLVRQIGLVHGESPAHVTDAPDPVALEPEEGLDEELHFGSVKKVGALYLLVFESDRFSHNPIHGDLRLAVSANGKKFRRVHPQTPLLATGPKGTWDENLLVTTSAALQEVGDMLYLFYMGCPNVYNSWPTEYAVTPARRGGMFAPVYMGLALLPRDRYAYAEGPGTLTTPPLTLGPEGLWLNADGEGLTVEALDSTGAVLARGTLSAERRKTVYRRVRWTGGAPTEAAQFRVILAPGERLYSLEG